MLRVSRETGPLAFPLMDDPLPNLALAGNCPDVLVVVCMRRTANDSEHAGFPIENVSKNCYLFADILIDLGVG